MKRIVCFSILALTLLFSSVVWAAVPKYINYAGKLTDKAGNIVPDGVYSMTFLLYTTATGGSSVWSESYPNAGMGIPGIQVTNGAFYVVLGSSTITALNIDFNQNYWLEIVWNDKGETFARQPFLTAPYAMRAEYANQANTASTLAASGASQVLPIGTILAWHKSLAGTPTLPSGFQECNGQVVGDSTSAYYNQTLPNLNGQSRFLRGSSISGTIQEDAFQGHYHNIQHTPGYDSLLEIIHNANTGQFGGRYDPSACGDLQDPTISSAKSDPSYGSARVDTETRPKNMSIVWIIKIK